MAQSEQMALQKGSLAVAVLSQLPRDNEENKPLFTEARDHLHAILRQGLEHLQADDEDDIGLDEDATA